MQRSYYGRRRQWRLGTLVVIILLITVFLVSCMAGGNVLWVKGFFGLDSMDLAAETTVRTMDPEGKLALRLSSTVLGVATNGTRLPTFTTENEAAALYRGAVLNAMLLEGYSTYTGNGELIKEAQAKYPHTSFVTLIPKDALETKLTALFGGSGTGHRSDGAFTYLDRVGMYTTAAMARECDVKLLVEELAETKNTYRMRFALLAEDGTRNRYTAIFQKKSEGVCVWRVLRPEE